MAMGEPEGRGGLDFSHIEPGMMVGQPGVHGLQAFEKETKQMPYYLLPFWFEDLSEDKVQVFAGGLQSL